MYKYIAIALVVLAFGITLGQTDSTIHLKGITASSKTATSTYEWSLTKTADPTELEFTSPFTDEKQVNFTITTTKTDPTDVAARLVGTATYNRTGGGQELYEYLDSVFGYLDVWHDPDWDEVERVVLFRSTWTHPDVNSPDRFGKGGEQNKDFDLSFSIPYGDREGQFRVVRCTTWFLAYEGTKWNVRHSEDFAGYAFTWTNEYVNDELAVTDEIVVPEGFDWSWDYPTGGWTTDASAVYGIIFNVSRGTAAYGGHHVVNTAYGESDDINLSDYFDLFVDVIEPEGEPVQTVFLSYSPGYYKNHQSVTTGLLPVTLCGTEIGDWNTAKAILSNPSAKEAWNSFRCHFLTLLLNCKFNEDILGALYNDAARTEEPFEWYSVADIIDAAGDYTSSTPRATLLAMKDIFDATNNNQATLVLCVQEGEQGASFPMAGPARLTVSPNPFSGRALVCFGATAKAPVTVSVFDATGRKVRDLTGTGDRVVWDGTDTRGRKLGAGVYLLKLVSGTETATLRVVISR